MKNVTVRDVYLAATKALLQFAVDQGLLSENPAKEVKVRVKRGIKEREKGFDGREAEDPRRHARAVLASDQRRDGRGAPLATLDRRLHRRPHQGFFIRAYGTDRLSLDGLTERARRGRNV